MSGDMRIDLIGLAEKLAEWKGQPVKIYRPGDRGFESRAQQCTHISKITNVGYKSAFNFAMDSQIKCSKTESNKTESIDFN